MDRETTPLDTPRDLPVLHKVLQEHGVERVLSVDVETFYDTADGYTLSGVKAMTMEAYIRDPRFSLLMVRAHDMATGEKFRWDSRHHTDADLHDMLKPRTTCLLAYNTFFESLVFAHWYGIRFGFNLDTAAAARWAFGNYLPRGGTGMSLESYAEFCGLPPKGKEISAADGKHADDFSDAEWEAFSGYCDHDAWLAWHGFLHALEHLKRRSADSWMVENWTYTNWADPVIELDTSILDEYIEEVENARGVIERALGIPGSVFRSRDKFVALLQERFGVTPGMKPSPSDPSKKTFALAKNDTWMMSMIAKGGPLADVLRCKLAFSSNIGLTRAQRLRAIADRGAMPLAFQYCGATNTNRLSGADKNNAQNYPKYKSTDGNPWAPHPIRKAIRAPEGFSFVACDLSQIEARVNAAEAQQRDLVEAFARGDDVYSEFASGLMGKPVSKNDGTRGRDLGKLNILGAGYRAGWAKLQFMAAAAPYFLHLKDDFVKDMVRYYRSRYSAISGAWKLRDRIPEYMVRNESFLLPPGEHLYLHGETNEIELPTGFRLKYPNLRQEPGEYGMDWYYGEGKGQKLHGGIFTENECQSLAWHVIEGMMGEMLWRGLRIVMQIHDEVILLVRNSEIETAVRMVEDIMRTPPEWWPELPVDCESAVGKTMAQLK